MTNRPHPQPTITPTTSDPFVRSVVDRDPACDAAPADTLVDTLVGTHFGLHLNPQPLLPAYPSAYPVADCLHRPFWQVNRLLSPIRDPKDAAPSVRVFPCSSLGIHPAPMPATAATQAAQGATKGRTGPGAQGSQPGPQHGQRPGVKAVAAERPSTGEGPTERSMGQATEPTRVQRLSQSRLARLRQELPQREQEILKRIGQHGYLTTDQIQRFVFTDHASDDTAGRITRRVLNRLEQAGLVGSLRRRQGGLLGGSAPTTWHLSPGGARFLSGQTSGYRRRTPSLRHLLHAVAVAEAHLQLIGYAASIQATSIDITVEPHSWRSYHGVAGERLTLKPDLSTTIQAKDEHGSYRDEYLLEVDRGTESLSTLLKKCQVYDDYYNSGAWQITGGTHGDDSPDSASDTEGVMPIVLWVMDEAGQADRLRDTIARSALPNELFQITTLGELTSHLSGTDNGGPDPDAAHQGVDR